MLGYNFNPQSWRSGTAPVQQCKFRSCPTIIEEGDPVRMHLNCGFSNLNRGFSSDPCGMWMVLFSNIFDIGYAHHNHTNCIGNSWNQMDSIWFNFWFITILVKHFSSSVITFCNLNIQFWRMCNCMKTGFQKRFYYIYSIV